jgi:hypothetical protein
MPADTIPPEKRLAVYPDLGRIEALMPLTEYMVARMVTRLLFWMRSVMEGACLDDYWSREDSSEEIV